MNTKIKYAGMALLGLIAPTLLFAQEAAVAVAEPTPYIDFGNTAWMIVATALVMLMTIPGLALFYGGLVRQKNVLNILMQCFILTAVITLEWVFFGYSLAFSSSTGVLAPFIGGFDWVFLNGIGINDVSPYYISQETARIPHLLFVLFQGMFAVITPALIIGAYAERIKFRGFLIFSLLWAIFVYNPVAHWVWSADGWLLKMGALDFAGGTVVHINAGIAALVMTLMIGNRRNYNNHPTAPHNIPLVVIGTALLWFGWFGFNAGSGLAADGLAISAFLSTHVATATAALTWALLDWTINKKPTVIGVCTGAVGGLVAITPAAGFVGVPGAVIIGVVVSIACFFMVSVVKHKYGYDDTLDAFGVHGVGGILGALLTGLLATPAIQASYSGLFYGNPKQLWIQLIATVATMVFSGVMTYVIFKIVDKFFGIRATQKEEIAGLDISQHNEMAYAEND
ncbi:MAG: ammonium transporter [Bacteroidota bacterium]|nr:ammonium transporter [Bacteroidota bacterium]